MYDYYKYLQKNHYSDLSLVQFFGLMTMYEINGNPNAQQVIIDSAADQLFAPTHGADRANPYCPTNDPCVAGIFNYLGKYSESAYRHATSHNDGAPPLLANSSGDLLTDAEYIGKKITDQQDLHIPFRGIHYGNGPSWQDAARNRLSFGSGVNQVLTMDGSFVAYRLYQENFWMCVTQTNYSTCAQSYGIPKK